MGLVAQLIARGFDRSRAIPFEKGAKVGCSQCEALCVNGVPCHETGCPNVVKDCRGCGEILPKGSRRDYCVHCDGICSGCEDCEFIP